MKSGCYCHICTVLSCILLSCTSSKAASNETANNITSEPIFGTYCTMKNLGIFYSEKEIFDILLNEKNRQNQNVSDLIRVYKENCCTLSAGLPSSTNQRRPFIAIESNYRPPRKLMAKQLSEILNGKYISVPPKCMREFLYSFDNDPELRRAYFGLSLYATAHEVRANYMEGPVITSGYWSDQTSFAVAKEFTTDKIPEVGHSVYTWPKDLLKPDVSFLLTVPQQHIHEGHAATNFPDNFQEKRLEAFRRMRKPRLREIRDIQYYDTVLAQMQSKMLTVFQHPRWKRKHVRY